MDLETFKEIFGKKKPQEKLLLFAKTLERIGDCRVHYMEARRNQNQEEANYYDRERKGQEERAEWLYSEVWNYLDECENERKKLDNDWR